MSNMSDHNSVPDLAAAKALAAPSNCPICHADAPEGEQWRAHLATHSREELVSVTQELMGTLEGLIETARTRLGFEA
jgi:hypothetical protein